MMPKTKSRKKARDDKFLKRLRENLQDARVRYAAIAQAADTSSTTVSITLHGKDGITDTTRERVISIAERMIHSAIQ